jgi:hypothetical protein
MVMEPEARVTDGIVFQHPYAAYFTADESETVVV